MAKVSVPDQFPAGLRVLVVDDDVVTLRILEQMLEKCAYKVTTRLRATSALNLLREKKGCFDLVLSDVHMPDMDGFKLLELVGLEMDLPVIMMSGDGRTSTVLKGVKHGACDFLVKPVREEELKNIWQHVVRKMCNGNKENENSGSVDENENRHSKCEWDDAQYASSASEGSDGVTKSRKKKKDAKDEDDGEMENDDPTASKKARVVWSVELHQQFVSAVNHLGIEKAVPKRILELMNVPGLTRENVASHLQKFRLYLKRLSGVAQQHHRRNPRLSSLGRIHALAASGQIPLETLATLQAELLGQPIDQLPLLQATLQGPECTSPLDPRVSYGPSLLKSPSNKISKPSGSNEDVQRRPMWPSSNLGSIGPSSNISGLGAQSMLPHQQQQRQKQSIVPDPSPLINVQPSCVVLPSQSSATFQSGSSPGLVSHNHGFNASPVSVVVPSQSSWFSSPGLVSQSTSVLTGFSGLGSSSPSVSSCSMNANAGIGTGLQVQNLTPAFSAGRQVPCQLPMISSVQGSSTGNSSQVVDQGRLKNLGFVGKAMKSIPSRFAVDEIEFSTNSYQQKSCGEQSSVKNVKQEPNVDRVESVDCAKLGTSIFQHFPNDFMSIFSE